MSASDARKSPQGLRQDDPAFKRILNRSGLCLPDGMPIVWLAWLAGHSSVSRVVGSDLMLKVSAVLAERNGSAFYYGAAPGVAEVLARNDGDIRAQETLDTYYTRNWSLWLDLYILLRTPPAVLGRMGAR